MSAESTHIIRERVIGAPVYHWVREIDAGIPSKCRSTLQLWLLYGMSACSCICTMWHVCYTAACYMSVSQVP